MDHSPHSRHIRLQDNELTQSVLEGAKIFGPDDEHIGNVAHLHGAGRQADVVFDVGGFLGIGSKRIAVAAGQLDFMRDRDGSVHAVTRMTADELKELPEHTD